MRDLFYSIIRTSIIRIGLTDGWHLRFRKRLRLKSGRLGKARYNASVNLAPGGASLSGSLGPLTLNIGLRGVTVTWRLGHGATITRQINFRRLLCSPAEAPQPRPADTDTPPRRRLRRKGRTNSKKRGGKV